MPAPVTGRSRERLGSGRDRLSDQAPLRDRQPGGRARWTLELLAGGLVRLTEHDNIFRETARRPLAENELKPWRKDMWCIPQVDGAFFARMEDVLDLSAIIPYVASSPTDVFARPITQKIG
jgi:hypothetical protein